VQAILDRRFPGGVRATNPIWLSSFRINERKVADYRAGRVFLAPQIRISASSPRRTTQEFANRSRKTQVVVRQPRCGSQTLASEEIEKLGVGPSVF